MGKQDVRWEQRFSNLKKAFAQLEKAVQMPSYSDLEREGLIQRFEYTYELSWNTLKDFLEFRGNTGIIGSKDAIRLAYEVGLITGADSWMRMVNSRTLTSHTYNEETAIEITELIKEEYYFLFKRLIERLEAEGSGKHGNMI
jgi:nucleotidyltransferase substrate binding protein (TIGR01987 family)